MIIKGQMIDNRYKIIRSIGEGGMANVYLAFDTILEREVAVKVLRGDLAEDEKFIRRFQREANAASSLRHPNIVEMYDVGEDNGRYFIVMEYVDGKTLKSLIKKRGALTLPEVMDIMLQLTSGIACAHDSYIIHRDIKPQNVLILEDGRVKITDFGIAMALNSNELTQTNSVMGSVHYLPPEQAAGHGSTIKSDIYSLGILMYELLTGKLPFKGENAVEIAIKQMKEPIPSVREINNSIPQSIENVILKACAKNPKNRYDSVAEMYEDIKTALDPSRFDERRVVYKYPEHDLEDTKIMPNLKNMKQTRAGSREDALEEKEEEVKSKKLNKKIIIVGAVVVAILALLVTFVLLVFGKSEKTYTIPSNLVGKTEDYVTEKLDSLGIKYKIVREESEDVEEGDVINVALKENTRIVESKVVKVTVSKGNGAIEIENYVGKNLQVVQEKLEDLGIQVITTSQKIDRENTDFKENDILEQSVKAGEKLKKNGVIELVYATLITVYPDFTDGTYTESDIKSFCSKNEISCTFETQETNNYDPGTIISQSRAAGVEVKKGVSLKIIVAKAKTVTNTEPDTNTENTDNSSSQNTPVQQ